MSILIFIVILFVLVVSHEFGHFIVAKKSGMRVDEFSFGFPPKLFGFKKGETSYNINLLPLGGYVKIYGENGEDSLDEKDSKRSFKNAPLYKQALVLVAGVTMNFLVAWLLLSVGFMSGLPSSIDQVPVGYTVSDQALTITSVSPNSPALKSGLKVGDKILSLKSGEDTIQNLTPEGVKYFVKNHSTSNINFSYLRAKDKLDTNITPEVIGEGGPMIGISMDVIGKLQLPIHKALWEGLKLSYNLTIATISGFYNLIYDGIRGQGDIAALSGPVGIVGVVGDAAKFGFVYLLSFTALISINLAVLNLIPFPALDGGQLLFVLIEKIKGSRINRKFTNIVNMVGFGLLMLLMIIITYHDIVKLL
jgi:regulator of sigma E protease